MSNNNYVAKYMRRYNKAVKMRDKKNDYTRKGKDRFDKKNARFV